MKPIKYSPSKLSGDGKNYTFQQPNLDSVNGLFRQFVECMGDTLKPMGMTIAQYGTSPKWLGKGELDTFDLTKLDKITFTLTLVRYK